MVTRLIRMLHAMLCSYQACCTADMLPLLASDVDSSPLPPIEEEHNDLDSDIDLDAMD